MSVAAQKLEGDLGALSILHSRRLPPVGKMRGTLLASEAFAGLLLFL